MQFFNSKKYKNIIRITLAVFGAMLIFMNGTLNVVAAEFKHIHISSCYSTVSKACTATHNMSSRTGATTRHCNNCNAQTSHTTYVYWDNCYSSGQSFEQGGYHVCKTCGSTSYSWGSQGRHAHNVSTKVLSCGKEGADSGTFRIENATPEWSAAEVTLAAGVTILDNTLALADQPYSWDEQVSWTSEATKNITENGTYNVCVKSADGRILSEAITVTNIDKTAPELTEVKRSSTAWTNDNIVITFMAEDLQSDGSNGAGLAELPYSYDNGVTYTDNNTFTACDNGVYTVTVRDCLGNTREKQFEVNNMDENAPVISDVVQVNEGWQSESVTMKVLAKDGANESGLNDKAYSVDGVNWKSEPEFTFSENGKKTFFVRDKAGNSTIYKTDITCIDLTAPVIEGVELIPDKIWEDKVEVTILARDLQPDGSTGSGISGDAYSIDGGITWQSSNTFLVEAGTTYDVCVRDTLLWESEKRTVKREEFPYPEPEEPIAPEEPEEPTEAEEPEEPEGPTEAEEPEEPQQSDEPQKPREPEKTQQHQNTTEPTESETVEENLNPEQEENEHKDENDNRNNKFTKIIQASPVEDVPIEEDMPEMEDDTPAMEETISVLTEQALEDNVKTAQVIAMPWYKTVAGKTVIVSTSAILLGNLFGILSYLLIFSARIYCIEDMNKERKLGRVFVHRIKGGYTVYLSDSLLKAASVPRYRIRLSEAMLKKARNARLLVESDEKNLEVLIQESIDFEL